MNNFINAMNQLGYKFAYVNKISDQQNNQLDCGLRSMLWLLFIEKYDIENKEISNRLDSQEGSVQGL